MRCLQSATNKTRSDRERNGKKLQEQHRSTTLLNVRELNGLYVMRMEPGQPAVLAYYLRTSGYKARGRARKRWINKIKETLAEHI
jgi:hypothetical protein